jgi:hypothetical protein
MRSALWLLLTCALALPACGDWQMSEFVVMLGWPPQDTSVKAMANAGFNVIMAPATKLDECRRHGIKALVMDATPEQAPELCRHPALWGYYVRDEPSDEEFEAVAEPVAAFHRADPDHPAYVNLMAWMNLERYLQVVRPRFLSYDYYQWWWGPHNHFGRLEAHRKAALAAGIPLVCWVEANSDPFYEWGKGEHVPDSEAKKRQSVYTALAYGVKGIQWFVGGLVFDGDELTEAGRHVARINAELKALGPELMRLQSVDVFHTDPVPEGCRPVPDDFWAHVDSKDWVLGVFSDQAADRHLLLVNRDHTRSRWAVVRVAGPKSAGEKFDKKRREWVPLQTASRQDWDSVEFRVAPGGGELLRFQ